MKKNFFLKILIFELSYLLLATLTIALLIYLSNIPNEIIPNILLIVATINVLVLGILIGKHRGHGGLFTGILIGLIYVGIISLIRFLTIETFDMRFLLKAIIAFVAAVSGAIIGVNLGNDVSKIKSTN